MILAYIYSIQHIFSNNPGVTYAPGEIDRRVVSRGYVAYVKRLTLQIKIGGIFSVTNSKSHRKRRSPSTMTAAERIWSRALLREAGYPIDEMEREEMSTTFEQDELLATVDAADFATLTLQEKLDWLWALRALYLREGTAQEMIDETTAEIEAAKALLSAALLLLTDGDRKFLSVVGARW